jgi:hypothetical protein
VAHEAGGARAAPDPRPSWAPPVADRRRAPTLSSDGYSGETPSCRGSGAAPARSSIMSAYGESFSDLCQSHDDGRRPNPTLIGSRSGGYA